MKWMMLLLLLAGVPSNAAAPTSPKINWCAITGAIAFQIVTYRNSVTEEMAYESNAKLSLPPLYKDVLNGFVSMVYAIKSNINPEQAAGALYASCAFR